MKGFINTLFLSSSWKVVVQDLLLSKKRKTTDTGTLRAGQPSSMTLNFINDRSRIKTLRDDATSISGRTANTSILSFPSVVVGDLPLFKKGDDKNGSPTKFLGDDGLTTNGCTSNTFRTVSAGFTLIELLVVVLIIGILAAVAVPQYQLAVMKSRVAALMPLLRSISDAEDSFYLANGYYTHIKNLDIALPQDYIHQYADRDFFWADGTYVTQCGKGCGGEKGPTVIGGLYKVIGNTGDNKVAITFYGQYSSEYQNRRVCSSKTSLGAKVCKSLGGESISSNRWLLP